MAVGTRVVVRLADTELEVFKLSAVARTQLRERRSDAAGKEFLDRAYYRGRSIKDSVVVIAPHRLRNNLRMDILNCLLIVVRRKNAVHEIRLDRVPAL